MKMTKTIREYIESQVTERMQEACNNTLTQLKEAANAAQTRWEKALDAEVDNFNAKLVQLAHAHNYNDYNYQGEPTFPLARITNGYRFDVLPEVKAYNDYQKELNLKRTRAVREIIATIELGGTKQELTEMLNALEF